MHKSRRKMAKERASLHFKRRSFCYSRFPIVIALIWKTYMFYMISGVQRLWQIFRLNPLTVAPSPWSLRARFPTKGERTILRDPDCRLSAKKRRRKMGIRLMNLFERQRRLDCLAIYLSQGTRCVIAPCATEPGAPDSGPPVLPDTEQRQQ